MAEGGAAGGFMRGGARQWAARGPPRSSPRNRASARRWLAGVKRSIRESSSNLGARGEKRERGNRVESDRLSHRVGRKLTKEDYRKVKKVLIAWNILV